MDKPTLFISHSSVDKDYLRVLKDLLQVRTSGTLEIFLSSDGQSIPFGTNWVHRIEAALDKASVMFVAVSPCSIGSAWIFFEAGYTYSRKVKVIPVGIMGVDIGRIPPPLNLLQGFNVVSHEGLNNLIAIINREYGYDFPEDLQTQDYQRLVMAEGASSRRLHKYTETIDFLQADLPPKISSSDHVYELSNDAPEKLTEVLSSHGLQFHRINDSAIMLNGARIETKVREGKAELSLSLDPLNIPSGLPLIRALFRYLYDEPPTKFWFRVYFPPQLEVLTTDFKVSSRLGAMGIEISPLNGGLFQFRNVLFRLEDETYMMGSGKAKSAPCLRVVGDTLSESEIPLVDLIDLLVEAQVVHTRP